MFRVDHGRKLSPHRATIAHSFVSRHSGVDPVLLLVAFAALLLTAASSLGQAPHANTSVGAPWSRIPPTGLKPADVPQFVAVTFDDNFGLATPGSVGGVKAIVEFYAGKHDPPGKGEATEFDDASIRATFFGTSIYVVDRSKRVLGGKQGEDQQGRNLAAWRSAVRAGHEMADHTVNHFNGGRAVISRKECCRARDWSVEKWSAEIASCKKTLTDPRSGIDAKNVVGFRAPFLSYNDKMFTALETIGFAYDSSVPNCFGEEENGTNCSWPHSLGQGSPDADAFARKLKTQGLQPRLSPPTIKRHPGLWELPVTTLIVPPDSAASQYHFNTGLRERIAARGPFPYPSLYEASTGKITGLDYTLLVDAGVTGDEMRAILEYNLDLHLSGNHSPLIFVAHAHLYAFSNPKDNPDTPSDAIRKARWDGLTAFISYALTKQEVRVVAVGDVLRWIQAAVLGKF
jgi:peptidoglycan/xylan/chitin deacetylase (PgdA/CDA1 family)